MTPFTEIYPLALATINDYRLDSLLNDNTSDYNVFLLKMQSLLVNAIPRFVNCMQSLDYTIDADDPSNSQFNNTLTVQEKSILGDYVALVWFTGVTNDITQVNSKLQGRDMKNYSEAQNLKEKTKYLIDLDERINKRVSDYQLSGYFDSIFNIV